tara:strand:+ start:11738 stop:14023 length:2286 start_codon:yes stop_codon:yes gene_type:complete
MMVTKKILHGGATTVFLLAGGYLAWDFPYARTVVFALSLICFLVLLRNDKAWLFFLPALLPVYDLGLYSGRIFVTEFDILVLFCLAALHARHMIRPAPSLTIGREDVLASVLMISALTSLLIYFPYGAGTDPNSFSSYKSPYNGLRVIKGVIWIWLFWPFLKRAYRHEPDKSHQYLITGILCGLVLMGIGVLWERGVFHSLVQDRNIYTVLRTLLDFSGSYRITGLFSSMHVGGTALDGYLVMVIPFGFAAFFAHGTFRDRLFSLICLSLGSYAIMVSFSRGLYMGFFVVLSVLALSYLVLQHQAKTISVRSMVLAALGFVGGTLYMYGLFQYGGYQVMLAAILTLAGALLTAQLFKKHPQYLDMILLVCGTLLMIYVSYDGFMESRWSSNSRLFSLVTAVLSCSFLALITYGLTPRTARRRTAANSVTVVLMGAIFWLAVIPSVSGYRMSARFSASSEDLAHRTGQWLKALDFMDKGIKSTLLGMGTGSYPLHYFYYHLEDNSKVHYSFHKTAQTSYLALGAGDFNIIQKVPLKPHTDYLLRARLKTDRPSGVTFKFCPKHIIFSERYTPQCISRQLKSPGGEDWVEVETTFNSRHLGQSGLFYWPTTLQLHYSRTGSIARITDIQLLDAFGTNLIANGDFSQGADRWIMVRDFSHDDWHTKNIFLHYYFEQGLFGLGAFLLLVGVALRRQYTATKAGDPLAPILFAAILGTLTVGFFGSIIDNPRIAFLFYLLVYLGLLNSQARPATVSSQSSNTESQP